MRDNDGMEEGRVAGIFIALEAGKPVEPRDAIEAVAGQGLRGDRYFWHRGSWSDRPGGGREITLIESEAVAAARAEFGLTLAPEQVRRNVVTEGVRLNDLVGKEFMVGDVRLLGVRLCEPCEYLEGLTEQGIVKALVHRAGLRADILDGGIIKVGDQIHSAQRRETLARPSGSPAPRGRDARAKGTLRKGPLGVRPRPGRHT